MNIPTRPSHSKARSMARPFSWRRVFMASTSSSERFSLAFASSAPSPDSSRQSSISVSNSPLGTGISSTWSGCFSSPAFTFGALGARPSRRTEFRRASVDRPDLFRAGFYVAGRAKLAALKMSLSLPHSRRHPRQMSALRRGQIIRRIPAPRAGLRPLRTRLQIRRRGRRSGGFRHSAGGSSRARPRALGRTGL